MTSPHVSLLTIAIYLVLVHWGCFFLSTSAYTYPPVHQNSLATPFHRHRPYPGTPDRLVPNHYRIPQPKDQQTHPCPQRQQHQRRPTVLSVSISNQRSCAGRRNDDFGSKASTATIIRNPSSLSAVPTDGNDSDDGDSNSNNDDIDDDNKDDGDDDYQVPPLAENDSKTDEEKPKRRLWIFNRQKGSNKTKDNKIDENQASDNTEDDSSPMDIPDISASETEEESENGDQSTTEDTDGSSSDHNDGSEEPSLSADEVVPLASSDDSSKNEEDDRDGDDTATSSLNSLIQAADLILLNKKDDKASSSLSSTPSSPESAIAPEATEDENSIPDPAGDETSSEIPSGGDDEKSPVDEESDPRDDEEDDDLVFSTESGIAEPTNGPRRRRFWWFRRSEGKDTGRNDDNTDSVSASDVEESSPSDDESTTPEDAEEPTEVEAADAIAGIPHGIEEYGNNDSDIDDAIDKPPKKKPTSILRKATKAFTLLLVILLYPIVAEEVVYVAGGDGLKELSAPRERSSTTPLPNDSNPPGTVVDPGVVEGVEPTPIVAEAPNDPPGESSGDGESWKDTLPPAPKPRTVAGGDNKGSTLQERRRLALSFISEVVDEVGPSVVRIDTESMSGYQNSRGGYNNYNNNPVGPSYIQQGQGSGLIFSSEGFILTNAHVVEGATKVKGTKTPGFQWFFFVWNGKGVLREDTHRSRDSTVLFFSVLLPVFVVFFHRSLTFDRSFGSFERTRLLSTMTMTMMMVLAVTLTDGRVYGCRVAGADDIVDIAVLQIVSDGDNGPVVANLPVAELGDSDTIRVGNIVIAVGCPGGLDNTVTMGIVSGRERSSMVVGIPHKLVNYIQTDAAINPGNSGGPLIDVESGRVVGINAAIRAHMEGTSFAIPINRVRDIMHDLSAGKEIRHGYIGCQLTTCTPDWARENNQNADNGVGSGGGGGGGSGHYHNRYNSKETNKIPEVYGALVHKIYGKSPVHLGGLKEQDVIQKIGSEDVRSASDASKLIDLATPGEPIPFAVLRNGHSRIVHVRPKDMSGTQREMQREKQRRLNEERNRLQELGPFRSLLRD